MQYLNRYLSTPYYASFSLLDEDLHGYSFSDNANVKWCEMKILPEAGPTTSTSNRATHLARSYEQDL